jgi:CheY-like chemotaxis protein
MMGGAITVSSTEGQGTTFSFTLNLPEGSAEKMKERMMAEENVDGSVLNGLSILVVDDNEYNRIVAKDTLDSKSKLNVDTAESADAAFRLLKQKHYDIILMDVQMPVMNGFEATRYIREEFQSPVRDIVIVALTASVLRTDLEKCRQAGMNSCIPKPFRASQLIGGIAKALKLKAKVHSKVSGIQNIKYSYNGVTNLEYLSRFCEGDIRRMQKYMSMFTDSAPQLIQKIGESLVGKDYEEIANQVHGFKTKWIMMGMTETEKLAMGIEKECRRGEPGEGIDDSVAKLLEQVQAAVSELKEADLSK